MPVLDVQTLRVSLQEQRYLLVGQKNELQNLVACSLRARAAIEAKVAALPVSLRSQFDCLLQDKAGAVDAQLVVLRRVRRDLQIVQAQLDRLHC